MSSILQQIVANRRREIAQAKQQRPSSQLERELDAAPPVRDFRQALRQASPIALIAEIKKASPSKGVIRADFRPKEIAAGYAAGGAAAISVLTDQAYFQGSLEILTQVRHEVDLPVLRKDFIIDPYQVLEARVAGADAVLLIAECLSQPLLKELYDRICELGMTPLVELYEEANLERVLELEPQLVGINSRDLKSFEVDLQRTIRLRQRIPQQITFVAESGIRTHEDVRQLTAGGVDAMLVGESLMVAEDVESAVRQLLQG